MSINRYLAVFLSVSVSLLSAIANAKGLTTYYHTDHLGSPAYTSNDFGEVKWQERYKPYGERIDKTPPAEENDIWYTGKPHDEDIGLTYMNARYYDPVVGRFMSIDPVGFVDNNLHSFNRYSYANNNPYKYVDPDGDYAELPIEGFSLALGVYSFNQNFQAGNYGAATIDALGIIADGILAAAPGAPGAVGIGIAAARGGGTAVKAAKGLAGLSKGQAKTALKTAQEAYKGTTRVGHALSKHAGRNPDIWGKVTGSQKAWNDQAMKHMREIFRGPGKFSKVTNNKGVTFLEKRLSDGRGIRLNQDHTFKGFID